MIANMAELNAYLEVAQEQRTRAIRCELTPAFSSSCSDAALTEALLMGLPMAQGLQPRILRSRDRGVILTVKIRYRQAVRMLERETLSPEETDVLAMARRIVDGLPPLDEEHRFYAVYDWVCRHVRYVHTGPGQKGYERLVCASGALVEGQANCQGFADVLYLLCGLSGIACQYRIGWGEKRLHVWNAVCVNGEWREADASKGARSFNNTICEHTP